MTLRDWMNEHFFDNAKPYMIVDDCGKELDVDWNEYENYEFVKCVPGESEDTLIVK